MRKNFLKGYYFLTRILLPLVAGATVYLFLRGEATIAEDAIGWSFVPRYQAGSSPLLDVFTGSFPDFCWLYALLCTQTLIWGKSKRVPWIIMALLYTTPLLTELLQAMQLMAGTGDWFDLIAYGCAILIHAKTYKPNHAYENNNQMVI
jgi:hypothetical protein